MAIPDTHVFPGFLTPVLTQLFFAKPPTSYDKKETEVKYIFVLFQQFYYNTYSSWS